MTDETAITDQVLAIAKDVFTAMIDGEEGGIWVWDGAPAQFVDPLHSWVDVHGAFPARAAVTAERTTCLDLARALMSMEPDEEVSTDDLVDAFGEVANVVGGNIKASLPGHSALSLPEVGDAPAVRNPDDLCRIDLLWRGQPISISVQGALPPLPTPHPPQEGPHLRKGVSP